MFNHGDWKSFKKSVFLKVRHYNPKEIVFQLMIVIQNIFNDRKNRYEEINCFRNGDITQHLTSVDIEVFVRLGGYIVQTLEGLL